MPIPSETLTQPLALSKTTPVHFVGIGGVGMSGLAKLLLELGYPVSGSDVAESDYTRMLAPLGATLHIGHSAVNLPERALVVVSSSIDTTNPEIRQAVACGQPIHHRSSLLREILQGATLGHEVSIGITGTHGKTTVTGLTGVALHAAGLNPTIIVGGKIPAFKTNAVLGRKYAVAELDESDGTILQYMPTLSLISNLELDHADHYTGGLDALTDTFKTYLSTLKPDSKVIFNVSCPQTKQLVEYLPSHCQAILIAPGDIFTGQESQPTYWLKNARHYGQGCYQGYVYKNSRMLGELNMSIPGRHNLYNGLCAIAIGDQLGADFDRMAPALHEFTGMGRRFEKVGSFNNALLVDDYAHHPTEVAATLKAARESLQGGSGRVIAVFQPHRYSRLKALWDDFCGCFGDADLVYIADVYSAHEVEIEDITSERFAAGIKNAEAVYVSTNSGFEALQQTLKNVARPGDIILSMGAGNITRLLRGWELSV